MSDPVDPKKLAAGLLGAPYQAPYDENSYQQWVIQNNIPQSNDYDMRGFYKGLMTNDPRAVSGINPNDQQLHFPDKWKLPNHPGFSTESQYYNPATMPTTPSWSGGPIGGGAESWVLRRPDGQIVQAEAPWFSNGVRK